VFATANDALDKISAWLNDPKNAQKVRDFVEEVGAIVDIFITQIIPAVLKFGGVVARVVIAAGAAFRHLDGQFRMIINAFLGYLAGMLHGAVVAFGWIPGLGPKLKAAEKSFTNFREHVNRQLHAIEDKTVHITIAESFKIFGKPYSAAAIQSGNIGGIGARRHQGRRLRHDRQWSDVGG
jgi:hypothetical protein